MNLPRIFSFFLAIAVISLLPKLSRAQLYQVEPQTEVVLRMIGHEVLLSVGDSTSRVLPIEKNGNLYRIRFDTEFAFNGEDLASTVNRVADETGLRSTYIVEVEECGTGAIAYSYQKGGKDDPDIVPCRTRPQPRGCYNLLMTLIEPEGQVLSAAPATAGSTGEAYPKAGRLMMLTIVLVVALAGSGAFMLMRKQRVRRPQAGAELIALGNIRFDRIRSELVSGQERIELSGKEADLLALLCDAPNTTIERDFILKEVWGDEGVYVGRTLDVFISKLRKKLEADPRVKIMNIRGVGYKLVVE